MKSPLALCDWRSTNPEDYTLSDHKTMIWEGESVQVHYSPSHEWWFAKELKKNEVILLKMYDSAASTSRVDGNIAMCECNTPVTQTNSTYKYRYRHSSLCIPMERCAC